MENVISLLNSARISYEDFNDAVSDLKRHAYTTMFKCDDGELLIEKALKRGDPFLVVTLSNRLEIDPLDNGELHCLLKKYKMFKLKNSFFKDVHFSTSGGMRFHYC